MLSSVPLQILVEDMTSCLVSYRLVAYSSHKFAKRNDVCFSPDGSVWIHGYTAHSKAKKLDERSEKCSD